MFSFVQYVSCLPILARCLIDHFNCAKYDFQKIAYLQYVVLCFFQISMDGPNVNWRFYKDFSEEMSKDFDCQSLNIGSCGLHILNNAFKAGGEASSWGIEQLFSSARWLFHDTPARREDFQKITGNTKFPLKFCKHRWLENVPVAERIQEILPDIAKYVKSAKAQQVSCPKTKSFEVIVEAMKDPLLEAKLAFFTLVAKEVYPFLVRYQTDKPMLPFLATDMHAVLKDIMKSFVKKDAIADVNRITKVVNMDVNSSAVQCPIGEVDIGFIARKKVKALLATKKISDRQSQQFKK